MMHDVRCPATAPRARNRHLTSLRAGTVEPRVYIQAGILFLLLCAFWGLIAAIALATALR